MHRNKRLRGSLREEQIENETAVCKIIGLTLETRPDCINHEEIIRFRKYGCTRVQLGIQHTDNTILKKINRESTIEDAMQAIKLLKESCYKIDVHLMPNLPGATPALDNQMFDQMLYDDRLQADQWKIYPCEVTPWTVIKKWFDEGSFVPYSDEHLIEVIIRTKAKIHPWIRLNRIVRDIPVQYILGGINAPNMRQDLTAIMATRGLVCHCIRCREVGAVPVDPKSAMLKERIYESSGGKEYFLSFENNDGSVLFGFLRLRIPLEQNTLFPELVDTALIRELHVYGQLIATNYAMQVGASQHLGFGRRLIERAEAIAASLNFDRMAVIAGVGTRTYYSRFGYKLDRSTLGQFSIKTGLLSKKLSFALKMAISTGVAIAASLLVLLEN